MEDQQQQQSGGGGGSIKQIASDLIESGPEVVTKLLGEIFAQLSDQGVDPMAVIERAMAGDEGGAQQQQGMPQPQGGPPAGGGDPAGGGVDPAAAAMEAEMMAAAMGGAKPNRGRITIR